ncbi:hypothetical protein B0T26DRAFT_733333 [Lasiosphaeria miniovina]|uniref:Uncharacterized protein n=1 Tax=Lasiosphaeria miniovina TaxID=1954250 RepID=A0AA40DKA7_9PEZI|nr:uncharacterized protein B0T26DRAFT_733333 [Lasiosphaeria miniovina]KAK0703942.1 hypothetical protein B0T26DRAFT_733333 [Lasiosphaeria miniovina]
MSGAQTCHLIHILPSKNSTLAAGRRKTPRSLSPRSLDARMRVSHRNTLNAQQVAPASLGLKAMYSNVVCRV